MADEIAAAPVQQEGSKRSRLNRRQKLALLGTATLAGIGGVSVLAAWSGTAEVGGELQAGSFEVGVSTDGGSSWSYGTGDDVASAALNMPNMNWAPGDSETIEFQIKLADDTTHNGVLSAVTFNSTNALGISWNVANDGATLMGGGGQVAGGDLSSASFDNVEYNFQEGGGPVVLSPGEELDLSVTMVALDNLQQGASTTASWSFDVELDN